MGFKDDKGKILEDLGTLNFDHQGRSGRTEEENLLAAGLLTPEEAIEIVKCTLGTQHENQAHHQVGYPPIWILKPTFQGETWYVKGYFLAEQTWFISFHPSKSKGATS
ncbi:MAG: hypothetical protein KC910_04520 [Candidatus Eremiobacteraeota bacterium]|nr:hypothetical protein [Candidatus Eremiobacteraeota bacterium]